MAPLICERATTAHPATHTAVTGRRRQSLSDHSCSASGPSRVALTRPASREPAADHCCPPRPCELPAPCRPPTGRTVAHGRRPRPRSPLAHPPAASPTRPGCAGRSPPRQSAARTSSAPHPPARPTGATTDAAWRSEPRPPRPPGDTQTRPPAPPKRPTPSRRHDRHAAAKPQAAARASHGTSGIANAADEREHPTHAPAVGEPNPTARADPTDTTDTAALPPPDRTRRAQDQPLP